ncbi:hypothetical protein DSO57_1008959 [Entomophthora muscae]|uniref:Uncharacterized protein n=1 Tax=Entomophthora muscae TaxID=34485 RepID=A0ACC2U5B7_9FUNG|nr:hypothetical protein DSO57_1008959 [Entomophthora muscae]
MDSGQSRSSRYCYTRPPRFRGDRVRRQTTRAPLSRRELSTCWLPEFFIHASCHQIRMPEHLPLKLS